VDLTVEVRQERPGYWARVVELPGCFASGRSLEELSDALEEAIGLYLWDHPDAIIISDHGLEPGQVQISVMEPFS
jgi:predicted RNase H-like HicB family nuclease